MKHFASTGLALLLVAAGTAPAAAGAAQPTAASPDAAAALVQELTGQGAPQTRTPEQLAAAYAAALAALLPEMASDDLARQDAAQTAWERICLRAARPGAPAERLAASRAMLARLGPDTPPPARLWLLRMQEHIGRAEAVPALTGLLDDKDPLVRERARRALANNPSPEAGQALRTALDRAAAPDGRIGLSNAVGYRRDTAAVGALARLLGDPDETVATAAAAALGKIGGPEAARALAAQRAKASPRQKRAITDAYLLVADRLLAENNKPDAAAIYTAVYVPAEPLPVRIAALRGLAAARGAGAVPLVAAALTGGDAPLRAEAVRLVGEIPGPEATKAFAALLPRLPAEGQVRLLRELGARGDAAARPAVLQAAQGKESTVRVAALRALGDLGGASEILLLARTAASAGPESEAARESLARLRGPNVDAALLQSLEGAAPNVRAELIRGIAARRVAKAAPTLLKTAQGPDAAVRLASLDALAAVGGEPEVPPLLAALRKAQAPDERQAAEKALIAVYGRMGQPRAEPVVAALGGADAPARASLLRVLAGIGGKQALAPVRAAVSDSNPEVRDAAVRALSEWPDPSAAPALREIARTASQPTHQVLALRGFLRLAGAEGVPPAEKLTMYQEGMSLARRPEEKKLVLAGVSGVNTPQALLMVVPYLEDAAVQEEAAAAAVQVARGMRGGSPESVTTAMQKVLTVAKDERVRKQASDVLAKKGK